MSHITYIHAYIFTYICYFTAIILENEDELSFVAGDLIILEEKIDDVWFKGYVRSPQESGIFPAQFVEVVVCFVFLYIQPTYSYLSQYQHAKSPCE